MCFRGYALTYQTSHIKTGGLSRDCLWLAVFQNKTLFSHLVWLITPTCLRGRGHTSLIVFFIEEPLAWAFFSVQFSWQGLQKSKALRSQVRILPWNWTTLPTFLLSLDNQCLEFLISWKCVMLLIIFSTVSCTRHSYLKMRLVQFLGYVKHISRHFEVMWKLWISLFE